MKIIHCADLHLDSKMNSNFDRIKAKERKGEILHTFERMVEYASEQGVDAILIAGDLFDTRNISASVRNTVLFSIKDHPLITFYYLRGNHDADNFLSGLEQIPENLKLFGSQWLSYRQGDVVISGVELSYENAGSAYVSLVLNAQDFNIVMLHGQESESNAKDKTASIHLKALKNKGIDYLALGHTRRGHWMPAVSIVIQGAWRGEVSTSAGAMASWSWISIRFPECIPIHLSHLPEGLCLLSQLISPAAIRLRRWLPEFPLLYRRPDAERKIW